MTSNPSSFPISVLSIPGLPNGIFPLDSTFYHKELPQNPIVFGKIQGKPFAFRVFPA